AFPGVMFGAFLANATAREPAALALGISVGNTLEAMTGAYLMRRLGGFSNSVARLRDVYGLSIYGAALGSLVAATLGTANLCLFGVGPWSAYPSMWQVWWLGDSMGALLYAPLILTWTAT